jgi:RimJ/RimL family protein N-acetyltransferase
MAISLPSSDLEISAKAEVGERAAVPHLAFNWRRGLAPLSDELVTLRELRPSDAASLCDALNSAAVMRYVAPGPSTIDRFTRFIRWTRAQRRCGRHACYGIVPLAAGQPVGIIQMWPIERDFSTVEWGFVLGDVYWGTGLFVRSAALFLDGLFLDGAFGPLQVTRLEARAAEPNARGNGVLQKLGATREGVLRAGFNNRGRLTNQIMWSILSSEWQARRGSRRAN